MNNFRPDVALLAIYERLGPIGLALGIGLVVFALRGNLLRGFGIAIFLLLASQSWFTWLHVLGRNLRWVVLLILCARGVLQAMRSVPVPWEPRAAHRTAIALGLVAVASSLWADDRMYTLFTSVSFVVSLVAAFWVLWRLADTEDVIAAACRGALFVSVTIFGTGVAWIAYAETFRDYEILYYTGWGGRVSGVLYNANMSGLLAMAVIPALLAAPRTWFGRAAFLRWPAIACAAAALYYSGSRSALIGLVISLTILYLFRFGVSAFFTVAFACVGVFMLATTTSIEQIEGGAFGHFARTKHIHTLSGRLDLWEEGLAAVQGRELLGLGWGASRLIGGADPETAIERGIVVGASNLHSTHIQILVDVGILGLGLLWLICLQTLWAGWRLLVLPRTDRSVAAVMVFACFVATFADSFVHGGVLSTGNPSALVFWATVVLVIKEAARIEAMVTGRILAEPPPVPAAAMARSMA